MQTQLKILPAFSKDIILKNNTESLLAENLRLKEMIRKQDLIIRAFKAAQTRFRNK